jgi:hypothetical protein
MANRLIQSTGAPEGNIEAEKGTFYINTQSNALYVKVKGDITSSAGWVGLICKGYYENQGNPEDVIMAPKLAYCLDVVNDVLYVQTTDSMSPVLNGWLAVTTGTVTTGMGTPSATDATGEKGDIYINLMSSLIYVKLEEDWMTLTQLSTNTDDILIDLAELLATITDLANAYFDLFISPEPMDVTISMYDQAGALQNYTIPNRAKDRQVVMGEYDPNDNLDSAVGTLYMNNTSRTLYIKTTGANNKTGWKPIIYGGKIQEPLCLDEDGKLALQIDSTVVNNSGNLVTSGTLYDIFDGISKNKADTNGDPKEHFEVAYPTKDEDAVNIEYVRDVFNSMFSYDSSTNTLKINTEIK